MLNARGEEVVTDDMVIRSECEKTKNLKEECWTPWRLCNFRPSRLTGTVTEKQRKNVEVGNQA